MNTVDEADVKKNVQLYYGNILQTNKDLQTNACCTSDCLSKFHVKILDKINQEIVDKYYGCGTPIPPAVEGCTIIDLGCGSGRDAYLLSYLVGEKGNIIGIDMTREQLDIANKYKTQQTNIFGFTKPNISFRQGYIEDLQGVGIKDNSVDIIVSNCVINLSPNKEKVFSEIFRVLRPGGELYISDVFSDRRIPLELQKDPILYGECISGAMYIQDFRRLLIKLGINDYRVVKKCALIINDSELSKKVVGYNFYTMTIRAIKLSLEDCSKDYGQSLIYNGTINECPKEFIFDINNVFPSGKTVRVCGNTYDMIMNSRYKNHFIQDEKHKIHLGRSTDCSGGCSGGSSCC